MKKIPLIKLVTVKLGKKKETCRRRNSAAEKETQLQRKKQMHTNSVKVQHWKLYVFKGLGKEERKEGRRMEEKKLNNENNTQTNVVRQGTSKGATEFIWCWLSTAGHEVCPQGWFVFSVRLHWRKLIFSL